MKNGIHLSIVSPVYLAEEIIDELIKRIKKQVLKITENYEIILVEDGSSDNSWQKIEENCKKYKKVKGVRLSRNFGQHYAITAGLHKSKGDYVVVIDCDLQDNPKYIYELINKSKDGFDIVFTKKRYRNHGIFKNYLGLAFHKVFNLLANDSIILSNEKIGGFSLLTRKVVDAFCKYNEYHRSYLPILRSLGFSSAVISIDHEERFLGKTSYSFSKGLGLALDGIVSHSNKLLRISIYVGFSFAFCGLVSIVFIVMKSITSGFQVGWASTMVLFIFCTGLILISIGIVGIYIGKIFMQTKSRPLYLIDKQLNID